MALTSRSWLLPVELSPDGREVVYSKTIAPQGTDQCYGVEDARIGKAGGRYFMATCTVGPERHATTLYTSSNALDWRSKVVLDHQNMGMLIVGA